MNVHLDYLILNTTNFRLHLVVEQPGHHFVSKDTPEHHTSTGVSRVRVYRNVPTFSEQRLAQTTMMGRCKRSLQDAGHDAKAGNNYTEHERLTRQCLTNPLELSVLQPSTYTSGI